MKLSRRVIRAALGFLLVLSFAGLPVAFGSNAMTVSPATYKQLQQIDSLVNQGQMQRAQARCLKVLKRKTLNPYEKSILQQMLAGIYLRSENYTQAIGVYEHILKLSALPETNLLAIHYTLAQLHRQADAYVKALQHLTIWLSKAEKSKMLKPEPWQFLASIYVAMEQYPEAIPAAKKALALEKPQKEMHYQLLLSLYQHTNKNWLAIKLLEQAIEYFPENQQYWMQLFYMLNTEGEEKKALAVLDLAYTNGLITEQKKLLHLAQLHLYHENPLRGGMILEKGLASGSIKANQDTLQMLSTAWLNAREYEKLLVVLKQSATLTGDGDTYFQLAQAYRELNRWQAVISATEKALADKTLKNFGACYLLIGLAEFELENYPAAQVAFEKSALDARTKAEAIKWRDYTFSHMGESH
ncbi:MAG: tetratricopeptide repeat protein [Gammaproteobacteria bacterium]|nr:tetratricopeptide repeat protein [Gammaproteobacteria bacterium]